MVLFTYLHLAPLPALTDRLLESKVTGIAYETIRDRAGTLPLLTPMSEVAGRMSVQVGATYLEKDNTANVFLTPKEQTVFCQMDKAIYPVPNNWGEKGATTFDLNSVPKHILMEALLSAYNEVIHSKTAKKKPPAKK